MNLSKIIFFVYLTMFNICIGETSFVEIKAGVNSGIDPDFGRFYQTNEVSFYMETREVSWALWKEVYLWATENGYIFSGDIQYVGGTGDTYPVHGVTYFDAIIWCNARSEMSGLDPCYVNEKKVPVRVGRPNACDYSNNGYRLPTVLEWEYAARGGTSTRFYWGDTISHDKANYLGGPEEYDNAPKGSLHPKYRKSNNIWGTDICTSPIGSFDANEFGLFDMAGNVCEWTMSGHRSRYRVVKGGSWRCQSRFVRIGYLSELEATGQHTGYLRITGIRCCKKSKLTKTLDKYLP